MTTKTKVALFGSNGHQIYSQLTGNPRAECVAAYDVPAERLNFGEDVKLCNTLDELLAINEIELVSLCAARRLDQADIAIKCLNAGKNVYAEKPCAFTEEKLAEILAAAQSSGKIFRTMAGTCFEQPWLAMKKFVASGKIGEIVQVFAQKSYPMHNRRPQDENIDGGLLMQVGIHAARFIEQISGEKILNVYPIQTSKGNPGSGDLKTACAVNMTLSDGGIATFIANYCNPKNGFGSWGNEHVRVFGTQGFVEATDAGRRTHIYLKDADGGELDCTEQCPDYFEFFLNEIRAEGEAPLTLEQELSPLRAVIKARQKWLADN